MQVTLALKSVGIRYSQRIRGLAISVQTRISTRFGHFELWHRRGTLTADGAAVPIGRRAFEILELLVERHGEIVHRDEIFSRVWRDVRVEENNLAVQFSALRKALGPDRDMVKTFPGRGYLFSADASVTWQERGPAPATEEGKTGPESPLARHAPGTPPTATNLPTVSERLIGRTIDLAALKQNIFESRLVALIGPGGVGKTRLALELGWEVLGNFPAGVWLIDLAPLTDPAAVVSATATTLRVALPNADMAIEAIVAAIGGEPRLLIFDNCEHLVAAASALIQTLLDRSPRLSVLATSQADLQIPSERVYRLDPLAVPPVSAIDIGGFGAVDLFVARARAADRGFELRSDNAVGVSEICRRLDGIPLALEMAAARVRMLGVEGLRGGLDDRLRMLKNLPLGSETRHGSLRAVLAWSHGLLTPEEQSVFRRLAAFPASFTLDAAVAVAGDEGSDYWETVDALGRLIDRSLVTIESEEPPRYRLLDTLRLYAAEQLRDSGEGDVAAERHARHFIGVFDHAEEIWETTPDPEWLNPYRPEIDNVRAALDWALAEPARRQIAMALAGPGGRLFQMMFQIAEGRRYLDRAIPLIDRDTPPAIAAGLLKRMVELWQLTRSPHALPYAERAADFYRQLDDRPQLAGILVTIGVYPAFQQRYAEGKAILLEAWDLLAGSNFKKTRLRLMNQLGVVAMWENDLAESRRYFTQALDLARSLKIVYEAGFLINLGLVEYLAGDVERAIERGRESVACARAQGKFALGLALCNLATYLMAQGNPQKARALLEEAFALLVEQGDFPALVCLQQWAVLGAFEGRFAEAAQLTGALEAERARRGQKLEPSDRQLYARLSQLLGAGLPAAELQARKAEGAGWNEAEAVEFVSVWLLPRRSL